MRHDLSGLWGRGLIAEAGACVLSWAPAGHGECLLTPVEANVRPGRMWHGGIPVCAPWFGAGRGDAPVPFLHGLVARARWRTTAAEQSPGGGHVEMRLHQAELAHLPGAERYPGDLDYRFRADFSADRLRVSLTICSPSQDVVVDEAFHPYLLIDAPRATVSGLDGVEFRDYATEATRAVGSGPVALGRHLDRVYQGAPATVLADGARCLSLSGEGTGSVVVWNPGPEGDLGPDWARFACVEYGNVQGAAITIPAGHRHTMSMTIAAG